MEQKRAPTGNSYLDLMRNTKTKDVKVVIPQKRQIVEEQHHRCYICHKALSEGICHFKDVHGPDPKSGSPSVGLRALCASCYFDVNAGKKPEEIKKVDDKKPEIKKDIRKESGWF